MKTFSQIVTWVFLPLFAPIYILLLSFIIPSTSKVFYSFDSMYALPYDAKKAVVSMFFVFCVLAPSVIYLELRRRKLISNLEMDQRKERLIPIIVMLVFCLLVYLLLLFKVGNAYVPKYLFSLPLSGVCVTALFALLNFRWKLSIHSGAMGIIFGFFVAYFLAMEESYTILFILIALISGFVMMARMFLGKHSLFEVVLGWLTAVFITFVVNYNY